MSHTVLSAAALLFVYVKNRVVTAPPLFPNSFIKIGGRGQGCKSKSFHESTCGQNSRGRQGMYYHHRRSQGHKRQVKAWYSMCFFYIYYTPLFFFQCQLNVNIFSRAVICITPSIYYLNVLTHNSVFSVTRLKQVTAIVFRTIVSCLSCLHCTFIYRRDISMALPSCRIAYQTDVDCWISWQQQSVGCLTFWCRSPDQPCLDHNCVFRFMSVIMKCISTKAFVIYFFLVRTFSFFYIHFFFLTESQPHTVS